MLTRSKRRKLNAGGDFIRVESQQQHQPVSTNITLPDELVLAILGFTRDVETLYRFRLASKRHLALVDQHLWQLIECMLPQHIYQDMKEHHQFSVKTPVSTLHCLLRRYYEYVPLVIRSNCDNLLTVRRNGSMTDVGTKSYDGFRELSVCQDRRLEPGDTISWLVSFSRADITYMEFAAICTCPHPHCGCFYYFSRYHMQQPTPTVTNNRWALVRQFPHGPARNRALNANTCILRDHLTWYTIS